MIVLQHYYIDTYVSGLFDSAPFKVWPVEVR